MAGLGWLPGPPPPGSSQVWGEGPCSTRRQQPSSLGQEPVHFYSSRSCVTLLLNPQGEVRARSSAGGGTGRLCGVGVTSVFPTAS